MIQIQLADLERTRDADALMTLLNRYALDPLGGGHPLPDDSQQNLVTCLRQRRDFNAFIAWDGNTPIGLCNCFEGFSTFASKPLLNIHDLYVEPAYRGRRLARKMIEQAEQLARQRGCCKLTLEVLSKNHAAKQAYLGSGFTPYQLDQQHGVAEFWHKPL